MKKNTFLICFSLLLFYSCNNDEEKVNITLKFTHYWDDVLITQQDFNQVKFINAHGEKISIERLRYLVSNINIMGSSNYHLINLGENSGNIITINNIQTGNHNLNFTFGFSDADNQNGAYQDLNTVNFNVPNMLGGGYHYMQFDGKYKDSNNQEQPFNYHTIRAVDKTDPDNLVLEDTSFMVNLGNVTINNNTEIEIKMNIAEWFKNPNTWDLNQLNTVLMPNFNAQKIMRANGKSVFSLGQIIQ